MGTLVKEYAIEHNSLVVGNEALEDVINNRQEKFYYTVEYKESRDKLDDVIKELDKLLPDQHELLTDLEDYILRIEGICYSAAYRDGMSDLMAAMTFNKLKILNAEYIKE